MTQLIRKVALKSDYGGSSPDTFGPFNSGEGKETDVLIVHPNGKVGLTPEGGIAVKLTNKTGGTSVKGTVISASTVTSNAFKTAVGDDINPIGVVYESGVSDGGECWCVVSGIAEVLLKDATASTTGKWVKLSDTAGRADATNDSPPDQVTHFKEMGHCIETKSDGIDVLAKIILHYN